ILLRQDTADVRLTPIAQTLGIRGLEKRMEGVRSKLDAHKSIENFVCKTSVAPDQINPWLERVGSAPLKQKVKIESVLLRPKASLEALSAELPFLGEFLSQYPREYIDFSENQMKYSGYIEREKEMADKMNRLDKVFLPDDFSYDDVQSLSLEAREKLKEVRPRTIGQASRISGVSPSDISVLLVMCGR
ncbi:MAG TPA: hypothetical protein VJ917_07210, partial [Saprospiraceae bacterium]|nr:hypothetical protein [Saprospiraceae bacterium]